MKTKLKITLLILVLISINQISAQTPITLHTPRGSNVYAHIRPELMSYQDKLDLSDEVELYYPQATEQNAPSATTTYNCHSYAWNMSEGGSTCTVAYYSGDTDESIYWTDYSYVETTEPYASKISYYENDHSAIQTSTQGIYISKWGDYPLMEHARDYGPAEYDMAYRKYYKLDPEVTGTTIALCENSQRTYSTDTEISGSDYYWTRNESLLDYVSGQDSPDYRIEGKSGYGDAWVQLQITTPSGEVATTLKKYFRVGIFQNTVVTGTAGVCPDELYTYTAQITGGHYPSYSYSWTYPSRWSNNSQWYNNILLQTPQYNMTYGTVRVSVTNACGTSGYSGMTVYPTYCGGYYMAFPNPSSSYVDIDIDPKMSTSMEEIYNNDISLSVYNKMGIVVLNSNVESLPYRIDTSILPNGEYVVKIITGKKNGTEKDQRFESLKITVNH